MLGDQPLPLQGARPVG